MHVMSARISQIAETPGSLYFTSVCEGKPSIRTLSLEPRPNVVRNSPCKFMIVEYLTSHTIQSQTLLLHITTSDMYMYSQMCHCPNTFHIFPATQLVPCFLPQCQGSICNSSFEVAIDTLQISLDANRFHQAWVQLQGLSPK